MASDSRRRGVRLFRFADQAVSSPLDLPELEEVDGLADSAGVIEVSLQEEAVPVVVESPPGATSSGAGSHCTLTQAGPAFLCRFAGSADFLVTPGGRIEIRPASGTGASTLRHLLLDHVLPRWLAHEGRLVIHAGAVRLGGGVIACLGPSGVGKSTLTASFLAAGCPVVSDDAVALSLAQGHVAALSTYRSLRLWPASVAGLYVDPPALAPVGCDTEKRRLLLRPAGGSTARPLSALFVLAPNHGGEEGGVSLSKLAAHEACMAFIENSFQLDASDPGRVRTRFETAAAVASRVPTYRLTYPRSFASLPAVRAAMLKQLEHRPSERGHAQDAP